MKKAILIEVYSPIKIPVIYRMEATQIGLFINSNPFYCPRIYFVSHNFVKKKRVLLGKI